MTYLARSALRITHYALRIPHYTLYITHYTLRNLIMFLSHPRYRQLRREYQPFSRSRRCYIPASRVKSTSSRIVQWRCTNKPNSLQRPLKCQCVHTYSTSIRKRVKDHGNLAKHCPYCTNRRACCILSSVWYTHPHLRKCVVDERTLKTISYASQRTIIEWKCTQSLCGCVHTWNETLSSYRRKKPHKRCPICSSRSKTICCEQHSVAHLHPHLLPQTSEPHKLRQHKPTSTTKLEWVCHNHAVPEKWKARIIDRVNDKSGCSKCMGSRLERQMVRCLDKLGLSYQREYSIRCQKTGTLCRYDFCVSLDNGQTFMIEMDGKQHFESTTFGVIPHHIAEQELIKRQKKDVFKMKLCIEKNISMVRVAYVVPQSGFLSGIQGHIERMKTSKKSIMSFFTNDQVTYPMHYYKEINL